MHLARIPKRNGTYRVICVPDAPLKASLRGLLSALESKAEEFCPEGVCHGFMRGRSPVTNARMHIGHQFTLSMDLKDFFDSVKPQMVSGKLSKQELEACFIDPGDGLGARPLQGLPTSPVVANIAAADMDKAILKALKKHTEQVVYTRYADDLTFSFDSAETAEFLKRKIPEIVNRCGFRLAAHKTRLMSAKAGRRHVTGVAVDDDGVHPTRRIKRRLRAAKFQAAHGKPWAARAAKGLEEWSKLKLPKPKPEPKPEDPFEETKRQWEKDAAALIKFWRLRKPSRVPEPKPEIVDGDFLITQDPAYSLGMSTFTTGWRSCMAHPNGQYRKGVVVWYALRGTSIACLRSQRTMTIAGVTRRVMQARCLVHHFRDGTVAYDRFYGDQESILRLKEWLKSQGIVPVGSVQPGAKVQGNVPRTLCKPYCDSLKAKAMTDKQGQDVWVFYRP